MHILTHIYAFSCIFSHISAYCGCIFSHIFAYSCMFMHISSDPLPLDSNPARATTAGSCKLFIASKLLLWLYLRRAGGRSQRRRPAAAGAAGSRRRCWRPPARLSDDWRSLGRVYAVVQIGCSFAGCLSPVLAARFGREGRSQTSACTSSDRFAAASWSPLRDPGSQPEPSALVVHSSPDLVACIGVPLRFWSVNNGWNLKVNNVWKLNQKVSAATIQYQQYLSAHGPLFKLAASWGAGAELNNENNRKNWDKLMMKGIINLKIKNENNWNDLDDWVEYEQLE